MGYLGLRWAFIVAICIAIFGFIPGMGLPGAVVFLVASFCIEPFYHLQCLEAQRMWPAALLATWLYPLFIPLGFWLAYRKVSKKFKKRRIFVFILVQIVGALLVAVVIESKLKAELADIEDKHVQSDLRRQPSNLQPPSLRLERMPDAK